MYRKVKCSLIIFFMALLPALALASPQSEALVEQGRQLLFNDGNPTYQGILNADEKFEAAVDADGSDPVAHVFRGVTRLASFVLTTSEDNSFSTIADLVQAMGIPIQLDTFLDDDSPFGEAPELAGDYNPPETMPNGDHVRTVLSQGLVGVIDLALADLDAVDATINVVLTAQETDELMATEVDYTDVLLAKAILNAVKTAVLIVTAYDLNAADIRELMALANAGMMDLHPDMMTELLEKYPGFLHLADNGAALLATAKTALQASSVSLNDAYLSLKQELDNHENQDNDLFALESEGDEQEFENVLTIFAELLDSLAGNRPVTAQDFNETWDVTFNSGDNSGDTLRVLLEGDLFGNGSMGRDESDFWASIDGFDIRGWVPYWKITGTNVNMILRYWGNKRIELTGTLAPDGLSISGSYALLDDDGTGYVQTAGGTFTAERMSHYRFDTDRFDLNAVFGNTGKSPLDIRNFLPQFDTFGEPLSGTFPTPVFNGLFPDYVTNVKVTEELELDPPYRVFTIPKASTTVIEGLPSAWPAEFLVNTDPTDDFFPGWAEVQGMNIVNTYLATDTEGQHLYVAMELSASPITQLPQGISPVNYQFEFRKDQEDWGRNTLRFNAFYNPGPDQWNVYVSQTDGDGNYQHLGILDDNFISAEGSYLEWKVPLALLGEALETFGGSWITYGTWSSDINDGDWVENNTKLAPVYTVSGTIAVPGGYAGEKIYLYLSDNDFLSSGDEADLGAYVENTTGFTLADVPYSSADLYLYAFLDIDGNGILNSGDYRGKINFPVTGNVSGLNVDLELVADLPINYVELKSVHSGNATMRTFYSVGIDSGFTGNVPWDIDTITLTDPNGTVRQVYPDGILQYDPTYNEFWGEEQGSPLIGEYTFTVTGKDGSIGVKSDTQKDLITIPIVDVNSVKINTGSKTPIVTWDPVSASGTRIAYRLEVNGMDTEFFFQTGRNYDLTACALPELQPGKQYQYRIRAVDHSDWIQVDNRSHTQWVPFTMDAALTHDAVPAVDLDGWGAVKWSHVGSTPGIDMSVKVIDHDGVAYNGSSHHVVARPVDENGTLIGEDQLDLSFDYPENGTLGYYTGWIDSGMLPSNFAGVRFFAVDPDGSEGSVTDMLEGTNITPPQEIGLTCVVSGTTPTFTWNAVSGADKYRVRIYDENRTSTIWKGNVNNVTTYTVPPGVLNPGTIYQYRLEARDGHRGFDTDENIAFPPRDASNNYPKFTTTTRTDKPYIEAETNGVATWSNDYIGTLTSFWIRVYDAQGAPGNIQSVKVTHSDGTTQTDLYYEYNESDICAIYSNDAHVAPQNGTYTFVVVDKDGNQNSTTEDLTVNPMGYPAESSLSVVVNGTGAEFDWADVTAADETDPAFYRLEIYNKHHDGILYFVTTQSQYSLAPGFLKKGELYGFRVTTRDRFWDQNTDNGSSSPWSGYRAVNFKTEPAVTSGSHQPGIDTDHFGAAVTYLQHPVTGDPSHWIQFSVKVTDADGVPGNIKSVTVQGPGIIGTLQLNYDSPGDDHTAEYWNELRYGAYGDVPEGLYTFTVEDEDGNTATATDTLVKQPVPLVSYMIPANGAVVSSDRPVIDWTDPAGGPYFYRVRIYQHWNQIIHQSGILDASSYIVPVNILKPGEIYGYRIYAYGTDPRTTDLDNVSVNELFFARQNHFTTMAGPPVLDLEDALKVLGVISGGTPAILSMEADVNKDKQLNLEDAIPILHNTQK
ncbi:hypothetical protein [Desulfobacula sp.]|uniref:hypothetical protein n=1 Tax=Desulfobacula sp. TaxID=2593537 RepID=UPI002623A197|nr:hypothetical protein [Desulfobacula sp.]